MKKFIDWFLFHLQNEWNIAKSITMMVVLTLLFVAPWAYSVQKSFYSGVGVGAGQWIGLGLSILTVWLIVILHQKAATRHGDK